jgi:hypothetical protein
LVFPLVLIYSQGCGSGLDPDSETLWIRIRIGNPDPDPGASEKNALFSYFFFLNFTTKKVELLFETNFDK